MPAEAEPHVIETQWEADSRSDGGSTMTFTFHHPNLHAVNLAKRNLRAIMLAGTVGTAVATAGTLAVVGADGLGRGAATDPITVQTINPALFYDVAVDVPVAIPERPAFDTPIERLIEANRSAAMNLGPTTPDGFSRWFEGS